MDLSGKYDKTNLLGDGEVQVWRGREKARGTLVLLHTFTGSPKLLRLATEYLLKRPPSSPLLDIGEWDGATCLVTLSELDMLDVTAWLESAVTASPTAAPEPPRPAPRVESTGPVPVLRPDTGPVTKPTTPTNPTPHGPGEFTRAFQIPSANVTPPRLPDPIASSVPTKTPAGPGEFTQLFQLPAQTGNRETAKAPELSLQPSPPDLHSPAPRSAGEFTRLFRAQPSENSPNPTFPSPELPAEPVPPKLSMATGPTPLPPRSAPPEPKGPGEYTRVMQAPSLQTPQPPAAPSPASAQAVQLPIAVSVTPSMPSAPSVPALPSAPTPAVPYVQTSIPQPTIPTPEPAAPRGGVSPIVLLFGALILIALVLVLIFALRK